MHSLLPDAILNVRNAAPKRLVIRRKKHDLEPIEAMDWLVLE
jgi:hypothetical protein